jgi:hypothetical protein
MKGFSEFGAQFIYMFIHIPKINSHYFPVQLYRLAFLMDVTGVLSEAHSEHFASNRSWTYSGV